MKERIESLFAEVENFSAATAEQAEQFRLKYLSKKGQISVLFDEFKTVSPEMKREVGQLLNKLKTIAQEKLDAAKEISGNGNEKEKPAIDLTLPAAAFQGGKHPLNIVRKEILDIFSRLGFTVADGPEI